MSRAHFAAKNLSRKEADIGEGYLLRGENGGLGDPLAPGAKKVGIIDDADAFLSMLGGANFNHNSIRDLTSTNNSTREKILSYIESLSASKSNGENIGDLVNKLAK